MASSALDDKRKSKRKASRKAQRARRRRRILLKLVRDLFLIAIVALLAYGGYHFFYAVFADEAVASSEETGVDVTVRIDSTMSDLEVAKMLKQNGLVNNAYVFFAQEKIFADTGSSVQPGTYQLNTCMTGQEIIEVITAEEEEDTDT